VAAPCECLRAPGSATIALKSRGVHAQWLTSERARYALNGACRPDDQAVSADEERHK
jgi:hypothetical protein